MSFVTSYNYTLNTSSGELQRGKRSYTLPLTGVPKYIIGNTGPYLRVYYESKIELFYIKSKSSVLKIDIPTDTIHVSAFGNEYYYIIYLRNGEYIAAKGINGREYLDRFVIPFPVIERCKVIISMFIRRGKLNLRYINPEDKYVGRERDYIREQDGYIFVDGINFTIYSQSTGQCFDSISCHKLGCIYPNLEYMLSQGILDIDITPNSCIVTTKLGAMYKVDYSDINPM